MKTEIHIGDCLEVLRTLPAGSVQTCITSPPYWGLRNYLDADSQIGLEKTPEDHIAVMVEVFREVRRVLRDDGTLWMNYGATYAAGTDWTRAKGARAKGDRDGSTKTPSLGKAAGLKPKDLCGMPWRVALALQADGWWLRSSIIWAKGVSFCDTYSGSVMPESCRDRPTRAHENLFLMSKAPRYFYDADAVREKHAEPERSTGKMEGFDTKGTDGLSRPDFREGGKPRTYNPAGRNLRDVWIINPQGFPGAHFATFPPALVEPGPARRDAVQAAARRSAASSRPRAEQSARRGTITMTTWAWASGSRTSAPPMGHTPARQPAGSRPATVRTRGILSPVRFSTRSEGPGPPRSSPTGWAATRSWWN